MNATDDGVPLGEYVEGITHTTQRIDAQTRALVAIQDLHTPRYHSMHADTGFCDVCLDTWPCPTIDAIREAGL